MSILPTFFPLSVAFRVTMALVWPWMLCFLLPFFHRAAARQYVVGGRSGWVVPSGAQNQTIYNQWAGRTRFLIGDTLLFKYNPAVDSVLHVTAQQYDACNTSSPIAPYTGGNTVFTLPRSGPFHFISGNRSNCQKGEKLLVVVLTPRNGSRGSPAPTVAASPGPSIVASPPSFASAPASTPTHKVPSSSPSPAPAVSAPSPSSSPAPVVSPPSPLPSPSLSPSPSGSPGSSPSSSPASVASFPSPSLSPTSSGSSGSSPPSPPAATPSAPANTPTASSPPPSASPPALVSAMNLVLPLPLLFLALKTLY